MKKDLMAPLMDAFEVFTYVIADSLKFSQRTDCS